MLEPQNKPAAEGGAGDTAPCAAATPAEVGAGCELCGAPGALAVGGRHLCPECIQVSGSCCPEFGAWDAWPRR